MQDAVEALREPGWRRCVRLRFEDGRTAPPRIDRTDAPPDGAVTA